MYLLSEAAPDVCLLLNNYLFQVLQKPGVNGGKPYTILEGLART